MIRRPAFALAVTVLGCSFLSAVSHAAPTIWTGPNITFSKASNVDVTQPQNQDLLTPNVRFTRGNTQGMFNIAQEANFISTSPADTKWATDLTSPSQTITATNYAALTFTTWQAAYNNSVGTNIVGRDAVVHLLTDDIYLNIKFTAFQSSGGGAFTYQRSTPVPEPGTFALAAIAGVAAISWRVSASGFGCRRK